MKHMKRAQRSRNRSQMPHRASRPISAGQYVLLAIIAALLCAQLALFGLTTVLATLVGCVIVFYGLFVTLKVVISLAARRGKKWLEELDTLPPLSDDEVGEVAIVVSAYDESQDVLRRVAKAIKELDYPADKITVFFAMEKKDPATIKAFKSLKLGVRFVAVECPIVEPFTKPKACNWVFTHYIMGKGFKMLALLDAEDRPDSQEARKAATAFEHLRRIGQTNVGCIQAELAFWNARPSWVSTFYWGEYDRNFNATLRGLDALGLIPPLGGTSNWFLVSALEDVARYNGNRTLVADDDTEYVITGPWDENNVTEDCDLAMRLYRLGWSVRMFNSVTFEEAPHKLRAAIPQKDRWILGFIQSCCVWAQKSAETIREVGFVRWSAYELLVGGTPLSLFLNPITWATSVTYIASRMANATEVTMYVERLYPGPIYYIGMFVAVGGNLFLWVQKLMVPIRRQELSESIPIEKQNNKYAEHLMVHEYGLSARLLLTPVWWAITSIPAWMAVAEFIAQRFGYKIKWHKTEHGTNMFREDMLESRTLESVAVVAQPKQLTTGTTPTLVDPLLATRREREGEAENH